MIGWPSDQFIDFKVNVPGYRDGSTINNKSESGSLE
jgi:hypothetical protein